MRFRGVTRQDSDETINLALSIPENIVLDDGRMLGIVSWTPRFDIKDVVKATIEVVVKVKTED